MPNANFEVFIDNETDFALEAYYAGVIAAIEKILSLYGGKTCENALTAEVNIIFVDETEIKALNRRFRKIDSVTDVLSFEALSKPDKDGRLALGDIAVCPQRAFEQAESYGHGALRELAFLAAHGTLHLLGYDHKNKEEEAEMLSAQEKALDELGIYRR